MIEIWKDIKDYEGYYQISNLANVRSLDRTIMTKENIPQRWKGKVLKQGNSLGYKVVNLTKVMNFKMFRVHRLVAIYFIDNPNNLPDINHKDGNRSNNSISNLEWCTQSMNMIHSFDSGFNPSGENHPNSKVSNDTVIKIKELLAKGIPKIKIAEIFGVSDSYVCRINKGLLRTRDNTKLLKYDKNT